jgi:hypothetical protein
MQMPTSEEVEAILRQHVASHGSSIATAAMWAAAKEKRLRFWDGADARSTPELARHFNPVSCTRSAQRIAGLFEDAEVAIGYVLRAGESGPMVYSFAVRDDVVFDGGTRHYGRALGYVGAVVGLVDLGVMLRTGTLRDGFAAMVARYEPERLEAITRREAPRPLPRKPPPTLQRSRPPQKPADPFVAGAALHEHWTEAGRGLGRVFSALLGD